MPHLDPFAVEGSETSISFNNKAHRKSSVTVCRCGFVGHDKLETGV